MKPIEERRTQPAENALCLQLRIPADLNWFRGHFPTQPLLPGVAQLDWVMAYGAELAPGMRFCAIDSVKFQRPVLPESLLELNLRWDAVRGVLNFEYVLVKEESRQPVSSGKIKLCP
ncbi:hydroxymyristoyl-ACP dehydratase [Enterobacteriaceae bacterium H20N1]|uniref:Hydroxymyristoyl-ACP dehydratase n=1 Tax=Dryocola boscaweniae TaxID=2925397 RepID=A0A9X2WC07_9ENTR|nr:hydroxymyristoyl-ACP dehydratase [Dryocola boscaweniae]MCT4704277.1 hydroxymyristoyl-ACP dehydratase [Dryocola boscaweniae]MCT4721445.1 hydroxymyristoyl-ACP dehydratase [Dryocola boscaweniae]